MHLKIFINNLI